MGERKWLMEKVDALKIIREYDKLLIPEFYEYSFYSAKFYRILNFELVRQILGKFKMFFKEEENG